MLESQINKLFSLPELKFTNKFMRIHEAWILFNHIIQFDAYKVSEFEVCPKCATKATKIHDQVYVHIKDVPIRDKIDATGMISRDLTWLRREDLGTSSL